MKKKNPSYLYLKNFCKTEFYDQTVDKKWHYKVNLIFDQVTSLLSQGHDVIISTKDDRIMEYWKAKLLVFAFSEIAVNAIEEIQLFFLNLLQYCKPQKI